LDFRQLGRSDIRIAPLVLGTNVFGWNVDERTSFVLLDAFIDAGFNAIDTADSYSRCRGTKAASRRPSSASG
jgi:aryl-alcohol dehydrogenase-like predicted oxidoreductase